MSISISKNTSLMQFEQKVHSIFHRARLYKSSSEEIQTRLNDEIYNGLNHKYKSGKYKFSNWVKGYISGLVAAQKSLLWNEMEFIYILDGVKYSTAKDSSHKLTEELYAANRGLELLNVPGHFYWKNSDKLYF